MYTRLSGICSVSVRTCRVPSVSCFFASLVSPAGPVIVTTGMVLLLRSGFRLGGTDRLILVTVVTEVLNELAARIVLRKPDLTLRILRRRSRRWKAGHSAPTPGAVDNGLTGAVMIERSDANSARAVGDHRALLG